MVFAVSSLLRVSQGGGGGGSRGGFYVKERVAFPGVEMLVAAGVKVSLGDMGM